MCIRDRHRLAVEHVDLDHFDHLGIDGYVHDLVLREVLERIEHHFFDNVELRLDHLGYFEYLGANRRHEHR